MNAFIMITGAMGGLGHAFVHECARRGYNLYLTDLTPDGESFADEIAAAYPIRTIYQPCDLTVESSRTDLFNAMEKADLRFWGLINVAGRDYEGAFLGRSRRQVLDLNNLIIVANTDLTHAVLNLGDETHPFMLINVCSLAAFFPMPCKAVYSASKRYLLHFSQALGEEIKDFGTVTALCPAGLPTTPEIMRKNAAHGFFGKLAVTDTAFVARRTIDLALKGRRLYVPGGFNWLLSKISALLPLPVILRFIGRRWQKVQGHLGYHSK